MGKIMHNIIGAGRNTNRRFVRAGITFVVKSFLLGVLLVFTSCTQVDEEDSASSEEYAFEEEDLSVTESDTEESVVSEEIVPKGMILASGLGEIRVTLVGYDLTKEDLDGMTLWFGESYFLFEEDSGWRSPADLEIGVEASLVSKNISSTRSGTPVRVSQQENELILSYAVEKDQYYNMSEAGDGRMVKGDYEEIVPLLEYQILKEGDEIVSSSRQEYEVVFDAEAYDLGVEAYYTDEEAIILTTSDYMLVDEVDAYSYDEPYHMLGIFVFDANGEVVQCMYRSCLETGTPYYEERDPEELANYFGFSLQENDFDSERQEYVDLTMSAKELCYRKYYMRMAGDGWKYQTVYMSQPDLLEEQRMPIAGIASSISSTGIPTSLYDPSEKDIMWRQYTDTVYVWDGISMNHGNYEYQSYEVTCFDYFIYDTFGDAISYDLIYQFASVDDAGAYLEGYLRAGSSSDSIQMEGTYVRVSQADISQYYKSNSPHNTQVLSMEQLHNMYQHILDETE